MLSIAYIFLDVLLEFHDLFFRLTQVSLKDLIHRYNLLMDLK